MVKISVLLLLFSLVGLQAVEIARANPIPWCFNPQMTVSIQSPQNQTTNGLPVLVSFTSFGDRQFSVTDDFSQQYARSFFYVVDGQNMRTMGTRFEGTTTTNEAGAIYCYRFRGQAYLTNLTPGHHNITVYYGAVNNITYIGSSAEDIYYNPRWQATAQFSINPELAASPISTPTATPSAPELSWIAVLPLLTSAFFVTLIFKRTHLQPKAV